MNKKSSLKEVEIIGFDLGHGETAVALAMLSATAEPQMLDLYGTRSILTAVAQHPTRGVLIGDDAFLSRNVRSLHIAFKSPNVERREVPIASARSVERRSALSGPVLRGCPTREPRTCRADRFPYCKLTLGKYQNSRR